MASRLLGLYLNVAKGAAMWKWVLPTFAATCALIASPSLAHADAAAAAPVLDQSQTVTSPFENQPIPGDPANPAYRIAQTFTAGVSGRLDRVELLLQRQFNASELLVEIRSVAGGFPTDTVLATMAVPESAVLPVGQPFWVSVPVTTPVESSAGTQYAIVVYAPSGDCRNNADCWFWWAGENNPYAAGVALFALDGHTWLGSNAPSLDFDFKTDVDALPASKNQCKQGGWQAFSQFKNQGACVSFVETNTSK